MCGRFAIDIPKPVFQKRFGIQQLEIQLDPYYNVSPGMFLPTIIRSSTNTAVLMKWGLIPYWSREYKVKFSNINARAETVTISPAYRMPFQKQRCLIPATGFYEWAQLSDGMKQSYFFQLKEKLTFAFAGIWDIWKDIEGKESATCAIITCQANAVVGTIHPRMPVILSQTDEDTWLNPGQDISVLQTLLKPYDGNSMEGYRVSTRLNNPHADDISLIDQYDSI